MTPSAPAGTTRRPVPLSVSSRRQEIGSRPCSRTRRGHGGDPDDPVYRNLFEGWAKDRFFPLYYSRERVESAVADRVLLTPASR